MASFEIQLNVYHAITDNASNMKSI